jgi:hypothetical protein
MANIGEVQVFDRAFTANGAITLGTIVKLSTDDASGNNRVIVAADSSDAPIGVALETVADGARVQVRILGIALVSANGAYALGDELMVASSDGEVDTFSGTSGQNRFVVGVALEAGGAAQNLKAMLIRIYTRYTA